MTDTEITRYKKYLFDMTDDQLDIETATVVKQDGSAMCIQLCYNDWRRRGKDARFLKAYNTSLA